MKLLISLATRINTQLQNYVSWSCVPEAKVVDAFLTDWSKQFYYIFPPFSLLGKVKSKIWPEKAHCIVIIPNQFGAVLTVIWLTVISFITGYQYWTIQYWYPVIKEMTVSEITVRTAPNNLLLPQDKKKLHPFHKNLTLAVVLIQWKY